MARTTNCGPGENGVIWKTILFSRCKYTALACVYRRTLTKNLFYIRRCCGTIALVRFRTLSALAFSKKLQCIYTYIYILSRRTGRIIRVLHSTSIYCVGIINNTSCFQSFHEGTIRIKLSINCRKEIKNTISNTEILNTTWAKSGSRDLVRGEGLS